MADFEGKQKWMASRRNMPTDAGSDELARLAPAIRAHSFFSARVANGHVLDKLREISDSYASGETDIATARLRLKQWLDRNGAGKIEEPGSREDARMANLWSTARLNLILRQNARMAYAAGEWEQGQNEESRRMFPYWRYVASTSESPRSSHRQYAGKIFRKDDPIWHRIFPPWDFNCKCSVEEVAADEVEEDKVEPLTKEDKLPAIADSGFAFDPAEALRVYDPELIHSEDLRENTVRDLMDMGCIQREDGKLEMPIDNAPEDESERLQKVLYNGSDVVKSIPGKIKPQETAFRIGGTIEESRDFYPSEEHTIHRIDGVDSKAVGRNDLQNFATGPVLDTVVPAIEEEQKLLLDNGILGFRGIIRIPPEEELTGRPKERWENEALANTGGGILGLNEKKLLGIVFMPDTRKKQGSFAVWYNFRASDRVRCLVLHEFGHQVLNRLEKMPEYVDILNEIKEKHKKQKEAAGFKYESCIEDDDEMREWFAENYCAWRMDPSLMDNPELSDIFAKILKRR